MEQVTLDNMVVGKRLGRGVSAPAFEEIVNRYMKDAYFIALGMVGNADDAEEISQEAFIRAYRHIDKLNNKRAFFPWFYQILRNLCFTHLSKRKKRRMAQLDDEAAQNLRSEDDDCYPEAIMERNEEKDMVWRAIGQLDEKHREVIILRHFQNMSYEDIAESLYCNKGTVTSRLYYARKKLKEILSEEKGGQN